MTAQNINEKHLNLLKYVLTAARINLAQHWKTGMLPSLQDWETKNGKNAGKGKNAVYILSKNLRKFKQEWFPYTVHITKQGNLRHSEYVFLKKK